MRKQVARTGFTAANDATDLNQVGTIMDEASTGKSYRYVLVEDGDIVATDVVTFSDVTGTEVTKDFVGGAAIGAAFAGVAVSSITDAQYGWVQIRGLATLKSNGAIAAGAHVVIDTTADGAVKTMPAGSEHLACGMAVSAAAGNEVVVMLNI